MFHSVLTGALEALGIDHDEQQIKRCFAHFTAMVEANRVMNLTRITDMHEAAVKHYADSLAILPWLHENAIAIRTVLDIGTGAGFPSVPLAIFRPQWSIVALDGTGKKIQFVDRVCRDLRLKNIAPIHAHSAHYESDVHFDLIVMRAIGALSKCLTLSASHLARGGLVAAYKTPDIDDEQIEGEAAARRLHLEALPAHAYTLICEGERIERSIVAYRRRR